MIFSGKTVAFVASSDLGRSEAFYVARLGFTRVSGDDYGLVVSANGTSIRISRADGFSPQPFTVLGWDVERIEEVVKRLTQAGVEFRRYPGMDQDAAGIWRAPSGSRIAWFSDPDGNVLSVAEHPH
jgi:catechol 2,3-dioxygenase-like lactoylglutathione lyase family enzyme